MVSLAAFCVGETCLVLKTRNHFMISFTRPTCPSSNRTFIPWGCVLDFVRISFTIPSVNVPVLWCCFKTIFTRNPGEMFFRSCPFKWIPLFHYDHFKSQVVSRILKISYWCKHSPNRKVMHVRMWLQQHDDHFNC